MKHFNKRNGIITRACSGCGGDLGDRHGKQRYCKSCHAAHMRINRPKHKELSDEARKKANCRAYTHVLIKRGKIIKGLCEVCNSSKVESHHEDYNNPRLVRWFCRIHHLDLHNGSTGRESVLEVKNHNRQG